METAFIEAKARACLDKLTRMQGHSASCLSMKEILNGVRKQCILWTVERSLQSLLAPYSMKEVQHPQNAFHSAFVRAFCPALCRR